MNDKQLRANNPAKTVDEVLPEDSFPPDAIDAGHNQTRAKLITGGIVAVTILVFGIIGGARYVASQAAEQQAAAYATPPPNAPKPAATVNTSTTPQTPFPVVTLTPTIPTDTTSQAQIRAIQEAQQAREAAIVQQQRDLAQVQIPSHAAPASIADAAPQRKNGSVAVAAPPDDRSGNHAAVERSSGSLVSSEHTVGYAPQAARYQLLPTTVINARLITAINSDLPGPAAAQVAQPVYDSATHSTIVIPQGSRLFGSYDNNIVSGQNRLLIAWTEIIFPDGTDFRMGAQPGTDSEGRSGFSGGVNNHYGDVFRAAFLMTVLGAGEAMLAPPQQSVLQQPAVGQVAAQSAGSQLAQLGNQVIGQKIHRPPTLTIDPPYLFQVFITRPLPLEAYRITG